MAKLFQKTFFPQNLPIFFRKNENIETELFPSNFILFYVFVLTKFRTKKHSSRYIIPHNCNWPWKLEPAP
jgi:hypothetical protein